MEERGEGEGEKREVFAVELVMVMQRKRNVFTVLEEKVFELLHTVSVGLLGKKRTRE